MKKLILAIAFLSAFIISCDNDLDIYAPNEEQMVVFGIINSLDSVHYIKVQRTFQEEGMESQAALDSSKIYYGDDEISVFVDDYLAGSLVDSYEFLPEWIDNRDSGAFVFPKHKVYSFKTPNPNAIFLPGEALQKHTYKLRIVQHNGAEDVTSETAITLSNNIRITSPTFNGTGNSKELKLYTQTNSVTWKQRAGALETFDFNFYYVEENINTQKRDTFVVKYRLYEGEPLNDDYNLAINTSDFKSRIGNKILPNDDVIRFPLNVKKALDGSIVGYPIEVDIWAAEEDLSDYIRINEASSIDLVESNTVYTNIQNGLGLFSSRKNLNVMSDYGPDNFYFSKRSLDSLACGIHTKDLNFVKYSKDPFTTEIIYDSSPGRCN
jgi:hypothetical protein